MTDPRRPPSSGDRRHSASRRVTDEQADLNWLEFLRTAGGTAPVERSSSNDSNRKRQRSGTEPERRNYSYPYPAHMSGMAAPPRRASGMNGGSTTGVSRETAIDLTTPPRQRPARPSGGDGSARASVSSGGRRRESDIALPKWQPDAEIKRCPVCNNEFSFWYRKHHCRKCGRVVCASCSPHRITIPRQYIVQPPNMLEAEFGVSIEPDSPVSRALGGGDVVRVCNPCVPDPWTPPDMGAGRGGEGGDVPARPLIEGARNAGDANSGERSERSERYRYMPPPVPATGGSGRSRAQSHQPPPSAPLSRSIPQQSHPNAGLYSRDPRLAPPPPPMPRASSSSASSSHRQVSHRYTQSSSNHPLPPIPTFSSSRRDSRDGRPHLTTSPSAPPQPTKAPRRQVKEEDECPVCGTELPPGEQVRETHIQQCIAERFSSGTPSLRGGMQPPPQQQQQQQRRPSELPPNSYSSSLSTALDVVASGSTPPPQPSPTTTRPRTTSYRPRGMALYKANEKDCISEDGEPQECVICFEEFQPGDEMGRMECLCKFHRQCIRSWWERKGGGSCPTHQLHD